MHQHVLDTLTVFDNHATSPDLKKAIAQASQMTKTHLDRAKKIWKDEQSRQASRDNNESRK